MTFSKIWRAAQALAVNAVTIYGVVEADWPVGTAIVLYWAENVLRSLILVPRVVTQRGEGTDPNVRTVAMISIVFNVVHAVFLAVLVGAIVPRLAPAERLEWSSFKTGLGIIALLLIFELLPSGRPLGEAMSSYMRRVTVVHLTIVVGMFGVVLIDNVTALFVAFAALKTAIDAYSAFR